MEAGSGLSPETGAGEPPFRWSVHPYAESPLRGNAALLVMLGTGGLAAWTSGAAAIGLAALGILLGSTASYFLPTRYEAGAAGLKIERLGMPVELPWQRFRTVERRGRSLFLSRFAAGGWAARLKSVRVDLPRAEGRPIDEYIQGRIGGQAAAG